MPVLAALVLFVILLVSAVNRRARDTALTDFKVVQTADMMREAEFKQRNSRQILIAAPLIYRGWKQHSYIYPVADSGVGLGRQTMIFNAGKTAFRPNGAQHVSLGQVNPRMRMNAAPG